jgi:class 3 adenylate cyclase
MWAIHFELVILSRRQGIPAFVAALRPRWGESVRLATADKQNPRAMVGIASGMTVANNGRATHAILDVDNIPLVYVKR